MFSASIAYFIIELITFLERYLYRKRKWKVKQDFESIGHVPTNSTPKQKNRYQSIPSLITKKQLKK